MYLLLQYFWRNRQDLFAMSLPIDPDMPVVFTSRIDGYLLPWEAA